MSLTSLDTLEQRRAIGSAANTLRQGFNRLIGRKKELAEQLAAARAAYEECERALSLCDRAEREIPKLIQQLECAPLVIGGMDGRPLLGREFRRRAELRRLLEDIPAIRKYWTAKRKALGFVSEKTPPTAA